jgi:hypothetical protein
MRACAILVVAAAGFAAFLPTAGSAAEIDVPAAGCARGQAWNGYRCEWVRPPVADARPVYRAPPEYVEDEVYEEPAYVARPVYVAPPLYVARVYRPPVYRYYAGPRYAWGYGHRYNRWR